MTDELTQQHAAAAEAAADAAADAARLRARIDALEETSAAASVERGHRGAELAAVQAELAGVKEAFAAAVESLEGQRGAARSALAVRCQLLTTFV